MVASAKSHFRLDNKLTGKFILLWVKRGTYQAYFPNNYRTKVLLPFFVPVFIHHLFVIIPYIKGLNNIKVADSFFGKQVFINICGKNLIIVNKAIIAKI